MFFDQLKAFHRVALTGSFTKAARTLFLTQPAVSQQIQILEAHFGITLFDRSGKKVTLTGEGEILMRHTGRLFRDYDAITHLFGRLQDLEMGKVVIGATAVVGTYFLPRAIGQYSKLYPGIEIDLQMGNSGSVHELLLEGNVDFGFAGKLRLHKRLKSVMIHREKLLLVGAPDNPLAAREKVTAADLEEIPFIWREKGTQTRELVERWFSARVDRYPRQSIEVQNVEAAKRLVVEGWGITVVPSISVMREIHSGLLKSINAPGLNLAFDYHLLYLKKRILSRAAHAFLEVLRTIKLLSHAADIEASSTID